MESFTFPKIHDVLGTNAGLLAPAIVALILLGIVYAAASCFLGKAMPGQPRARTNRETMRHADSILDSGGFTLKLWMDEMDSTSRPGGPEGWYMALAAILMYWIAGTIYLNVSRGGTPFSDDGAFTYRLASGLGELAGSFTVFVAAFSLTLPFQLAVTAGLVPWLWLEVLIRTAFELAMLLGAVWYAAYGYGSDWPWTQKAGLLLGVAVLVLKVHSYLAVNAALARGQTAGFGSAVSAVDVKLAGGEDADEPGAAATGAPAQDDAASVGSFDLPSDDEASDDGHDLVGRTAARRGIEEAVNLSSDVTTVAGSVYQDKEQADEEDDEEEDARTRKRSSSVAKIRRAVTEGVLDASAAPRLTQTPSAVAPVAYPDNVTMADFVRFACCPSVVYSPNFPSTKSFRPLYFAEKMVLAALLLFIALEVVVQHCLPVVGNMGRHYADPGSGAFDSGDAIARLIVPTTALMLALFFMVFDVLLNAFAEVTLFGDRRFYGDWWNATSFSEFSRKWNRPVHNWLLHHVYLPLQGAGLGTFVARYGTFGVSIVAHEVLLHAFFGLSAPWLLVFSLFQFPLFTIMRLSIFKGKRLGNFVFWFGMALGAPLVGALYLNDFCQANPQSCLAVSAPQRCRS